MSITIENLGLAIKNEIGLVNTVELTSNIDTIDSKINNVNVDINDIVLNNSLNYWNSPSSIDNITNSVLPGNFIFVKDTNTTQKIMFNSTDSLHSNVYNTLINEITIKCIDNNTVYTLDETSNNISINTTEKSITFSYSATLKSDHFLSVKLKKPNGSTILTYTKNILKDKIFEFPNMVQTTKNTPYDLTHVTVGETVTLNTLFDETIDFNLTITVQVNDQFNNRTLSKTVFDKTITYDLLINNDSDHTGTINFVLVGSIQQSYTWNAANILTAANHIYSYPTITQHIGFDNDYGNFNLKINEAGKIRLTLAGGDGLHSNVFSEQLEFVKYKVGTGGTFINRDNTYVTIDKANNTIEITDITPTSTDDNIYISVKLIGINPLNTKLLADRIIDSSEIRGNNFITTMKVLYVWDNDPDTDGSINHTYPITWSFNHASNYNLGTLTSWRWGNGVPETYQGNPAGRGTNAFLYNAYPSHWPPYEWQNSNKTFEVLTWTVPGTGVVYKLNRALAVNMFGDNNNWHFLKNGALPTNLVRNGLFNANSENMSLDPGYWTNTGDNLSINHVFMFKLSDIDSISSDTDTGNGQYGWWLARMASHLGIRKSGISIKQGTSGWTDDRDGGITTSDWEHNHSLTTDPNKKYFLSVGIFYGGDAAVHFSMGDFPGFTVDSLILIEARILGSYQTDGHYSYNDYRMTPSDIEVKIYFWADNMWKSTIKKTRSGFNASHKHIQTESYVSLGGRIGGDGNPSHTWFANGYSDDNWVNEREDAINFLTERYTNSTLTTQQLVW